MRRHRVSFATLIAVATATALVWLAFVAAPAFSTAITQLPGTRSADAANVDVELILAVDVSYSMDPDEQALQREGYISALTSAEFLNALKSGMHGRVAVTYFEWASVTDQKIVM